MTPGSMGVTAVSVESVIRAMSQEFCRRVRAADIDGMVAAYYAENALIMPPNHPSVRGRGRIREFFRGFMEGGLIDLTMEATEITASGDIGYEVGSYKMTLNSPSENPIEDTGKYVVIFRRQSDGSWKAVIDIFNSDRPA